MSSHAKSAAEVRTPHDEVTEAVEASLDRERFFGLTQGHTQAELDQARAQAQAISLLLSSPQATLLSKSTTKGGVATVLLAADRHQLVVFTNGLPALPAGQVYQLWLIGKTKTVSAGLLPPAQAGRTPRCCRPGWSRATRSA
jgi:hypothetical protein